MVLFEYRRRKRSEIMNELIFIIILISIGMGLIGGILSGSVLVGILMTFLWPLFPFTLGGKK